MITRLFFAAGCILFALSAKTQAGHTAHHSSKEDLFAAEELLFITITGNIKQLLNDREGTPKYFPFTLSYRQEDGSEITIPVNIKTRGHFRRMKGNCRFPPLLIQFPGKEKYSSGIFPQKAKLKLVMPCIDDEYVVREWMAYKIYNLVTEESFRARLVKVMLKNEKDSKTTEPFFGILLEEEKQMAKRNGSVIINRKLTPLKTLPGPFLKMATFQYLIGNTDWSVEYLQNIKLIAKDSLAIPVTVPYDFDHAGIVNTPYAEPAEALQMTSVRQRRYRGYCIQNMAFFDSTIACFNRVKSDIYNLYTNCTLLDAKYVKATLKYLDEFYETINSPKTLQKEFGYPCDKNGTGNVVIKGLRED